MSSLRVFRSTDQDEYYFDLYDILIKIFEEADGYFSVPKRLLLCSYLYAIEVDNTLAGFMTIIQDSKKYADGILSIDLCLLKEYRNKGYGEEALKLMCEDIIKQEDYDGEFIILENDKTNDRLDYSGTYYDEKVNVLQGRLNELRIRYPDGIRTKNNGIKRVRK